MDIPGTSIHLTRVIAAIGTIIEWRSTYTYKTINELNQTCGNHGDKAAHAMNDANMNNSILRLFTV